jgi:hypothetical protein
LTLTYAINPENMDLLVNSSGTLQCVYGAEEVRQRILIALNHFYGEYFLNVMGGVPWDELILGSKNISMAEALLRRAVLEVPNVVSIIKFQVSFSSRRLAIELMTEVNGIDGPEIIDIITALGGYR